jgi:hypothetical protein
MESEFADCKGWKLVNDFTIHEERELSDRPMMITCVPNDLKLELLDLQLAFGIEWTGRLNRGGNSGEDFCHTPEWMITARGVMLDRRITVFHLEDGVIAQFDQIDQFNLRGVPKGKIGGKLKTSVMEGIAYSGMSSQEVPEKGLMVGEPGMVVYFHDEEDELSGDEQTKKLEANLYVEQEVFGELVDSLKNHYDAIQSATASVLLEVFQGEVEASLAEPWMMQEYGIRLDDTSSVMAATNARLERIDLVWRKALSA